MNITFAGCDVTLTAEGAVWIEAMRLLCVADLHFEKDSFFNRFAIFLPPYGSLETLRRLQKILDLYRPDIFIAAGDSFHDKLAAERMQPEVIAQLNDLIANVKDWYWITGNHDPAIAKHIKGHRSSEFLQKDIIFRHQAIPGDDWEISGHYHPKTRFAIRSHTFSAPCFVQHEKKLFLPAFGEYTGGLNIDSVAFQKIVPKTDRFIFPIYRGEIISLK